MDILHYCLSCGIVLLLVCIVYRERQITLHFERKTEQK